MPHTVAPFDRLRMLRLYLSSMNSYLPREQTLIIVPAALDLAEKLVRSIQNLAGMGAIPCAAGVRRTS